MNWRDPWANLEEYRDPGERKKEIDRRARSISFQAHERPGSSLPIGIAEDLAESYVWQCEQARFWRSLAMSLISEKERKHDEPVEEAKGL